MSLHLSKIWPLLFAIVIFGSCRPEPSTEKEKDLTINLQGHRGCRGLLPENTIPAFLKAVELGVTTLEMDVVITGDNQVLVSHEAFMNAEICQKPDGSIIMPDEMKSLNIYEMSTDSVQQFICGTFFHPRFLEQRQQKTFKPLLSEVVAAVEDFCEKRRIPEPLFNIEIKSSPDGDGLFHPEPENYVSIVNSTIDSLNLTDRCTVQSFDLRILQEYQKLETPVKLIVLNEKKSDEVGEILDSLSFKPFGYSPHFSLVDEAIVKYCEANDLEMPVWTVNDAEEINRLLNLGVTNIITDYPELARKTIEKAGYKVLQRTEVSF